VVAQQTTDVRHRSHVQDGKERFSFVPMEEIERIVKTWCALKSVFLKSREIEFFLLLRMISDR
jgi:hypothetical protein